MANQSSVFQPAIDELEKDLAEAERHVNALRTSIDLLRSKAGMGPRPEGGGPEGGGGNKEAQTVNLAIKSDQFFGKKQQTAIREFLDMRKALGKGPSTPREIFDGLKAGGFTFEAKDDNTAMIGLRATLRKRSEMFVKIQNGNYGLRAWYPDAKKPKTDNRTKETAAPDSSVNTPEKEATSSGGEAAA